MQEQSLYIVRVRALKLPLYVCGELEWATYGEMIALAGPWWEDSASFSHAPSSSDRHRSTLEHERKHGIESDESRDKDALFLLVLNAYNI